MSNRSARTTLAPSSRPRCSRCVTKTRQETRPQGGQNQLQGMRADGPKKSHHDGKATRLPTSYGLCNAYEVRARKKHGTFNKPSSTFTVLIRRAVPPCWARQHKHITRNNMGQKQLMKKRQACVCVCYMGALGRFIFTSFCVVGCLFAHKTGAPRQSNGRNLETWSGKNTCQIRTDIRAIWPICTQSNNSGNHLLPP